MESPEGFAMRFNERADMRTNMDQSEARGK